MSLLAGSAPAARTGRKSRPAAAAGRAGARARAATLAASALAGVSLLGVPLLGVLALAFAGAAAAQPASRQAQPQPDADKMVVEANEMRQDETKNTISAIGDARVYYKGRILQADEVTYDRNTGRVTARGNAKLTEADGTILRGAFFDLTDDFRDGFVESLRAESTQKTFMSAPRAERIDADTTVFTKGVYTACSACGTNYDKPPLWRVRAKRIIHRDDERMLYFTDATIDILGVPVAWTPWMSMPDPSVTRKSGILSPTLVARTELGYGLGVPIFWALAPDYDLTFTPTYLSKQGFLGIAEWRQRLDYGEYYFRGAGIRQLDPDQFAVSPWGAADNVFRGSLESKGEYRIGDMWRFGWQFTAMTDKWFRNDYNIASQTLTSNYISEVTSAAYLTGQGGRGFFDLRAYHFQGLSTRDIQAQQTSAYPVFDYNKTFDLNPADSFGLGGQFELDVNFASLSAWAASFQSVGTQVLDSAYSLYPVCTNYVPGRVSGTCLQRGVGGVYTRASIDLNWKRQFIDELGEVWTPFAFARINGQQLDLNTTNTLGFSNSSGTTSLISNASQLTFMNNSQSAVYGALNPGVGLEYRYPFFARTDFGAVTISPVAQVIVRPNNQIGAYAPSNLDAQSLVFDESSLFAWNKYSGYDRFETGGRANYGGEATLNFPQGGYINVVAGQSYQLFGTNSYATPDAANVGLASGLDTRLSDYIGAVTLAPFSQFSVTAKTRFDVNDFAPKRIDLIGVYNFGPWTGGFQYASYAAQPEVGYYVRRQGLTFNTRYQISDNYWAQGNVTFDMSRQFYPASLIGYTNPGPFAPAAFGFGGGYKDDCATFAVNFSSVYQDNGNGGLTRNQTVLLQFELRTLGELKASKTFSAVQNLGATN